MEPKVEKWVCEHEIGVMELEGRTMFRVRDICDALNIVSAGGFLKGLDEKDIYREARGASPARPAWIAPDAILKCLGSNRQRGNLPLNRKFGRWIMQWVALDMATRPQATPPEDTSPGQDEAPERPFLPPSNPLPPRSAAPPPRGNKKILDVQMSRLKSVKEKAGPTWEMSAEDVSELDAQGIGPDDLLRLALAMREAEQRRAATPNKHSKGGQR